MSHREVKSKIGIDEFTGRNKPFKPIRERIKHQDIKEFKQYGKTSLRY